MGNVNYLLYLLYFELGFSENFDTNGGVYIL